MMTPRQFVEGIIRPANEALGLGSAEAEQIMLGTALQESGLRNIPQEHGPALGYFQDEPEDFNDLFKNFLEYQPMLEERLLSLLPAHIMPSSADLIPYPIFAAGVCRLHYKRAPGALPLTLEEQAAYYKQHYNTAGGAATTQEYLTKWNSIVGVDAISNWAALMPTSAPSYGV